MPLTQLIHQIISEKFLSIDYGIDATCGNGYDTLFLAKLCSDSGKVFSFDIQKEALENAKKKINENCIPDKVKFVQDGHENIFEYINQKAEIIMFNLGYLPNSDKKISTKAETTIIALESAIKLLSDNGLISIICYPGHEEGKTESEKVEIWLNSLNRDLYSMAFYLSEIPDDSTPILYVLEKKI